MCHHVTTHQHVPFNDNRNKYIYKRTTINQPNTKAIFHLSKPVEVEIPKTGLSMLIQMLFLHGCLGNERNKIAVPTCVGKNFYVIQSGA